MLGQRGKIAALNVLNAKIGSTRVFLGCSIMSRLPIVFHHCNVRGVRVTIGNETKKGHDKWGGDQGCNHGGMIQEGDSECQQGMAEGRFEHQEGGGGVGAAKNDSRYASIWVSFDVSIMNKEVDNVVPRLDLTGSSHGGRLEKPLNYVETSIKDAPSPSNSQTTPKTQSLVISNDVEEENHDLDVAHMNNDPFFGISFLENDSEASSSSDIIPTIVHTAAPNSEQVTKWTKDNPLDNIIGELERPISTRLQLYEQALFCYYDAFLTSVEPKSYKDALTQACWIEAMQEELNEFKRLEV
ncbi:hypothetical protein Tco_0448005 [Tanacetum coccineum]